MVDTDLATRISANKKSLAIFPDYPKEESSWPYFLINLIVSLLCPIPVFIQLIEYSYKNKTIH